MTRVLSVSALVFALGLAFTASAGERYAVGRNVPVRLPPGPCIDAGGRVDRDHHDACVVPLVRFEPADLCQREHGVMVVTTEDKHGCALREPQSGKH